jgi:hypothetical protein
MKFLNLLVSVLLSFSSFANEPLVDVANTISNNFTGALHSSGSINVHAGDTHFDIVNKLFVLETATSDTFSVAVTGGDHNVTVTDASAFSVGDLLGIEEGGVQEATYPTITAKPGGNVLTLDRELEHSYTTSGTVTLVDPKIEAAIGSLVEHKIFKIAPPTGEIWHITRIVVSATDNSTLSDEKFISATALTNGLSILRNGVTERVLTNWKCNGDMILDSFDFDYNATAGSSLNGLRMRWTIKKSGAVERVDGTLGETLEVRVHDDIASLGITSIRMKAQGHIED